MEDEQFSSLMRKATRDIHAVSDALVNGKLALAMSNNAVWAEGLLVFYEIFRYLEEAMQRLRDKPVGELFIMGMERTEAFQADLAFYLGGDWTTSYTPRESVAKYLIHLMEIEKSDPDLLIAYVYHLYMGLFSGGQVLRKKRQIVNTLTMRSEVDDKGGDAVVSFQDPSCATLKREMKAALNNLALSLDAQTKTKILHESRVVFQLNNTLIHSVKGAGAVVLKKVIFVLVLFLTVYFIFYFLYKN